MTVDYLLQNSYPLPDVLTDQSLMEEAERVRALEDYAENVML